jgi:alkanesulfonate monooxygenase SsuD/methylene tetrahydromethanopterin reductase-like flavin-dependent oxidoreductase (luciferase family)
MAQCAGLALATERISFGTAIAPIYARTVEDFAHGAAYLHEVSGGRFRFGIGIAHGPTYQRLGVTPGKPLADIRTFVEKLKSFRASERCRRSSWPPCARGWSLSARRLLTA